jgi:hypothetical protein
LEARRLLSLAVAGAPILLHRGDGEWDEASRTDVAILESGGFVVAWTNGPRVPGPDGVWVKRVDALGREQGEAVRVDAGPHVYAPSIAADASGDSVLTWMEYEDRNPKKRGSDIFARRLSASGGELGETFRVNTSTAGDQGYPEVATNARGDFAVAWGSEIPKTSEYQEEVYLRQYDAAGQAKGEPMRVTKKSEIDSGYEVALGADGGGVVTWAEAEGEYGITHFQRFSGKGTPRGGVTRVGDGTFGSSVAMRPGGDFIVAVDDGGYPVVWRYDGKGRSRGKEVSIDADDDSEGGYGALVAATSDGRFAVLWNHLSEERDPLDLQRFSSSGAADTPVMQVTRPEEYGLAVAGAIDEEGGVTAVWINEDGEGIFAQRFESVAEPASVSGKSWRDADYDGRRGADEAALAGVDVQLLTPDGTVAGRTKTDADGGYGFAGLRPGDYRVQFSTRNVAHESWEKLIATRGDVGGDDADSDIGRDGRTKTIRLGPGEKLSGEDGGFLAGSRITGYVFNDTDGDGESTLSDGLSGWLVFADTDGDGKRDDGEPAASTDAWGYYELSPLRLGRYVVGLVPQRRWTATTPESRVVEVGAEGVSGADFGQVVDVPGRVFRASGDAWKVAGGKANPIIPAVASAPDGRFVVLWATDEGSDTVQGLSGRYYSADGKPVGRPFEVVKPSGGCVADFDVAVGVDGGFVVAWSQAPNCDSGDDEFEVHARRYAAGGKGRGAALLVAKSGYESAVALDGGGDFVVGWKNSDYDGDDEDAVFVRRYDAGGRERGRALVVTREAGFEAFRLGMDAGGGFAVAWGVETDFDPERRGWLSVSKVRLYDRGGNARGDEIRVNPLGDGSPLDMAMNAAGQFVVAWYENGAVKVQRFESDGLPVGAAVEMQGYWPYDARVAIDSEGGFVLAYDGEPGVIAERYHGVGLAEGGPVEVGQGDSDFGRYYDVASDSAGNFVVAWQRAAGAHTEVVARRYVARSPFASAGGIAWQDGDADGVREDGEAGLADVPVTISDSDGVVIATTRTASDGSYQFDMVRPGEYLIEIALPSGWDDLLGVRSISLAAGDSRRDLNFAATKRSPGGGAVTEGAGGVCRS